MKLVLNKKPRGAKIIEGFPGFGLIGTIATEYIINHLDCELIGKFWFDELPATVAIHEEKLVNPIGIYYNKKNHLVIIHSISAASGVEWKAADLVLKVARQIGSKEIISLEGVASPMMVEASRVFYYSNRETKKKSIEKRGIEVLKEGIIMGITSALMLKSEMPITCFFAETHSNLPDSKSAARIIEILDKYLGLGIDPKPLLKQAESFENKLKSLVEQSKNAKKIKEKKSLSYVG